MDVYDACDRPETAYVSAETCCRRSLPQAQLCQQLQLRIELNPSQMAAQSTLIGTALTADILGVVPDHRRGDRAADRPPIAGARSALQGARP